MSQFLELCRPTRGEGGGREEGRERPWKSESEQFLQQSCPDIAFNDEETVTIFPSFCCRFFPFQTFPFHLIHILDLFQSSEAARGGVGG